VRAFQTAKSPKLGVVLESEPVTFLKVRIQYSTSQYSTVQHSTVQYRTVQYD